MQDMFRKPLSLLPVCVRKTNFNQLQIMGIMVTAGAPSYGYWRYAPDLIGVKIELPMLKVK